jgi:hypothetical protein
MKKLIALIAVAGLVIVGCAHKENNMGGSSNQSTSTSGSRSSIPSGNYTYDTNTGSLNNSVSNPHP